MSEKPTTVLDPVCGMTVNVATAEANGLTLEHEGRMFAFCRAGCRRAFLDEPETYLAKALAPAAPIAAGAGVAVGAGGAALPVIDEGMRRWYEACSCCLGDAFPEVKAQLDEERKAKAMPPVDPGICEVAEATS